MNWYKKAQEIETWDTSDTEEPPKWEYPGAFHDYNPAWDYEIDVKADQEIVRFVEQYVEKLKKELLPQIGFIEGLKVGYVRNDKEASMIARYISETETWPVIIIDIERTKDASKEYGSNIYNDIEMSILHELGHAIQECSELPLDERQAEEFAFEYQFYGELWRFWDKITTS